MFPGRTTSLRFASKVLEIREASFFAALPKGEEIGIHAFDALQKGNETSPTNKIENKHKKQKKQKGPNLENNFWRVEPLSSDVDLQLVTRLERESLGLRHGLVTVFLIKGAVCWHVVSYHPKVKSKGDKETPSQKKSGREK